VDAALISKFVVFCPNWVGDAVMATPTLRALRRRFASAEMLGLARPSVAEVLAGTPWFDRVLTFDPRSRDRRLGTGSAVDRLRDERLDLAVLLTNSLRSAVLAWRAGIRRRVGYARDGRSLLLTDALPLGRHGGPSVPRPVIDYYLQLAYWPPRPTTNDRPTPFGETKG
jgi:heptosyltransferase-2